MPASTSSRPTSASRCRTTRTASRPTAIAARACTMSIRCSTTAASIEATERRFGQGLVFARSGWAGSQRFPVQWGGDPQMAMESLCLFFVDVLLPQRTWSDHRSFRCVLRTTPRPRAVPSCVGAADSRPRRNPPGPRRVHDTPTSRIVVEVTDVPTQVTPSPAPTTLGELRASRRRFRPVKAEIRANLLARLGRGEPSLPGIVGFDDTVLPEVERAILAGHDLVLLGERGQGKTRLIRTLVDLLDEWTPVLAGTELNEHPLQPISVWAHRQIAEHGDETPVAWLHRSDRLRREAGDPGHQRRRPDRRRRPDQGGRGPHPRRPGDASTSAWSRAPTAASSASTSCPTSPSASRSRCSTCWRSATSRSAATSCGCRWTCCSSPAPTPRTTPTAGGSSPRSRTASAPRCAPTTRSSWPTRSGCCTRRRASSWTGAGRRHFEHPLVPEHLAEIIARFTRLVRESSHVDQRSGVSARFAIAGLETVAASAVRRAAIAGETRPVARVVDLPSVVPASRGKVEFADSGADPDDEREVEVLEHLLRQATAQTLPRPLRRPGPDRSAGALHRRRDRRVRRAGARRRRCSASWAPSRGWPSCSAGSGCRRASSRPSRRPPPSSSPSRGLPDPPAGQGHRRHPHGLRRLT